MQAVSQDRIAQLAYQLWQERGCPDGSPEVDWERAVRMLESPASSGGNEVLSAPARTSQTSARLEGSSAASRPAEPARPFQTDGAGAATAAGTTRPRGGKGRTSSRRSAI